MVHSNAQRPGGLSINQIEQLVKLHNPDAVIAKAVQSKGLSFAVTPKALAELKAVGIGGQAYDAIHMLMRTGSLMVTGLPPGAQVQIDDDAPLRADDKGGLHVDELLVGKHHLTASAPNYAAASVVRTIASKSQDTFAWSLNWLGGYLSVTLNVPRAYFHFEDGRNFHRATGLQDVQVPPGHVNFRVTWVGLKQKDVSVDVVAGEHQTMHIDMEKDTTWIANQISIARNLINTNSGQALTLDKQVLEVDPENADAIELLSELEIRNGDFDGFVRDGERAIELGQTITLNVMHIHIGWKSLVHDATLKIGKTTIMYDPLMNACSLKSFTVPLSALDQIQFDEKASDQQVMELRIANPGKDGKTVAMNFTLRGTVLTDGRFREPQNSNPVLHAFGQLIEKVKGDQK
jgi:hypothetical protein